MSSDVFFALIPCRNLIADTIGSSLSFPAGAEKVAGSPDAPIESFPNSTIVVPSVPREFDGTRQVKEQLIYTITVRQLKPTSGIVEDFKLLEAQKLANALLAEKEAFGQLGGYRPHVMDWTPTPTDASKSYVEWTLIFQLWAVVFQ